MEHISDMIHERHEMHESHELKMPESYVNMSAEELRYDGGFSWAKLFSGIAIAGIVIAIGGIAVTGIALSAGLSATAGVTMIAAGVIMAVGGGILSLSSKSVPGDEFADENNRFHVT